MAEPYITKDTAEKLLGRSLTTAESNAFNEYEAIAESRLANLLCVSNLAELLTALGMTSMPVDLQMVLARFVGAISQENNIEYGVESKKVEDFSINYASKRNVYADEVANNGATIAQYSQCTIRHGKTLKEDARYYHHDRI